MNNTNKKITILGIETSCDETAAAIVTSEREVLSNEIYSQIKQHQEYGGVVPEIASRAHVEFIESVVSKALASANMKLNDVDAIAVTSGPGLIGGLIVGVMFAKGLALSSGKPLIGVNHLEGHALTTRLTHATEFPFLLLLVSGGHCMYAIVEGLGKYEIIGKTIDDALGEAFDKTAKMLGIDYPGGPKIEQFAKLGDENRFNFPKPLYGKEGCDYSFSGLKTAVLREVTALPQPVSEQDINDICASFQKTAGDIIIDRTKNAIAAFKAKFPPEKFPEAKNFVISGGVSANQYICGRVKDLLQKNDMEFFSPPLKLCTDNAAMIAWAGLECFVAGQRDGLDLAPRARWPLGEMS
jgi:N6-L-threonylcarbamoyladenine synthase